MSKILKRLMFAVGVTIFIVLWLPFIFIGAILSHIWWILTGGDLTDIVFDLVHTTYEALERLNP